MAMIARPQFKNVGDTQTAKISNKEQKTGSGTKDTQTRKKNKIIFSKPSLLK